MTQRPEHPSAPWPALDYAGGRESLATLHRWTQVVGKVRLGYSPWLNHGWQVPLYVSARGLTTSLIHAEHRTLEIDFDLVDHRLVVRTGDRPEGGLVLEPMSVAAFYRRVMALLEAAGLGLRINVRPSEVPDPIPFPEDEVHASYDAPAVHAFWRALVHADRTFRRFRTAYLGKSSPVHFFWGSFDLAVTRFSGRRAPLHAGGIPGLPDAVTREAYSHEVCSAGFWPGGEAYPRAAFYAYAYPSPAGFEHAAIQPDGAAWSAEMGEWLLPYDIVRRTADPEVMLLSFLQSTYAAAADLGHWDRSQECEIGEPGRPRPVQPAAGSPADTPADPTVGP